MNAEPADKEFRFTGRHMFLAIAGFFLVIISVNVTMAVFATRSWTGLVVENSYVASQHFNEELENSRRQSSSGWHSALAVKPGRIELAIDDADGARIYPISAELRIGRPAFEQQDRTIALKAGSNGILATDLDLAPGIWVLEFHAETPKGDYRRKARVLVSENGEGRLE